MDLAKRNARVILACRSVERGETAAVGVRKKSGNDNVVFVQLDLASLARDSVRKFAAEILDSERSLELTSLSTMLVLLVALTKKLLTDLNLLSLSTTLVTFSSPISFSIVSKAGLPRLG